eukprot:CAMPEP_0117030848 /NCGR_PEP_ID=MMETSP0472-20121206/22234_1 /TAXON_ID=693140 ORGANISM="Tiarina fusus, Strain LIS" /NCGR_SAMPLE_ID=MMETSP0472 /ASSEMBLY_ACC=CAM_ASM_000603 /LENGTH=209 /DNA_ID=CAMNT_0004739039 /DNA_START=43 /DNA_END=669 /DNA_ORIENTATION=+
MTIKIERDALLCVLSRPPSLPSSSRRCGTTISDDEEFVLVDIPKSFPEYHFDKSLRRSPSEDDHSLCTLSTDSLSDSSLSIERRVSFSTPLVTEEWTRPWTAKEDISNLYYSTEETQRFRQEYRLERKVLSDLSIDPDSFPVVGKDDLSKLVVSPTADSGTRHRISRVVVLHNDRLETFVNPNTPSVQKELEGCDFFDNDSFWSGSLTW